MSATEIEPTATFAFMLLSCHIHCTDKYSHCTDSYGLESCCFHLNLIAPVSNKEIHDIQATVKCRFTLKHAHGTITYSQMHHADKFS